MLRQGDTGDWVGTFEGHKGAVWGVALNSSASLAATGAADFSGKVWNALSGEEIHSFQHKHIVKSVAFNRNSEHLVTGSNEKLIRVFNLQSPNSGKKMFFFFINFKIFIHFPFCKIDPEIYVGHAGAIKRALFCRNDKYVVSVGDDKSLRLWDRSMGQEVQRVDFTANANSLELSADGNILTVAHGSSVSFWETDTLKKFKEITVPTIVGTASLHPDKHIFVCGGEDFKMYKYDYITGNEIESFKGHFGPIHAVKFSPDGELYASGSEDGTLRLWQTTVGKTYGLWKCTEPGELNLSATGREVSAI